MSTTAAKTEFYLLINGAEWGPFDPEALAEIQATAKRPYKVIERTCRDS